MTPVLSWIIWLATVSCGILTWIFSIFLFLSIRESPRLLSARTDNLQIGSEKALREISLRLSEKFPVTRARDGALVIKIGLSRLQMSIEKKDGGSSLSSVLDMTGLKRVMVTIMAILVLVVEPLFIFGISLIVWFFALSSSVPALRWQTLQVFQMIHVLWPPFLVYFLFTRFRRGAKETVQSFHVLFEMME